MNHCEGERQRKRKESASKPRKFFILSYDLAEAMDGVVLENVVWTFAGLG
jgi:hypothetical protein